MLWNTRFFYHAARRIRTSDEYRDKVVGFLSTVAPALKKKYGLNPEMAARVAAVVLHHEMYGKLSMQELMNVDYRDVQFVGDVDPVAISLCLDFGFIDSES